MEAQTGWLNLADRERQARAFTGWYSRLPTGDWLSAFARWADGKDFHPEDRAAIERASEVRLLAMGVLTYTDPMEAA